jgi:sec-independent protein translocase protein TatA
MTAIPLFPGIPGGPELIVILLIAVLLFGANKIPELARSSGQAIGEFQKGREEVEQELEEIKEGDKSSEGPDSPAGGSDVSPPGETEPQVESQVESTTDGDTGNETETQ